MKYYFLKLKDDFFTSEKVIALESCPKGSTALLALIKMQSLSLKKDGVICMTESKGFSENSLAAILNINKDDIQDVLNLLVDFEFISIASNKVITILDFENLVMSETKDAERKRASREKKKQELQEQKAVTQEPIQHGDVITVAPTNNNQSQSKSNNQSEEEEEREQVYDNQIALISCVEEEKPENSANFRSVINFSVPPKANNFSAADNVRTRPENVRQILDTRDKRLEIRNSVCNIISGRTKNTENFKEKIFTHTLTKVHEDLLVMEFGETAKPYIKKFKAYCEAYGKFYKDPLAACRYWILQDLQKSKQQKFSRQRQVKDKYTERHYDQAFYDKLLTNSRAFLEG